MKRLIAALALTTPLLALPAVAQLRAAPQGSTAASADIQIEGIAAIVNDEPISYSDVRERARLLLVGIQAEPDQATVSRIAAQAREQLIEERIQLQKAAEFDLKVEDADVREAVADMAASSGLDVEGLYRELLAVGVNPVSLESQMRADIAWRRLMSGLYGSRLRVSEDQIDDRLEMIRLSATRTQYQLSEIFLYAPEGDERRQQAIDLANTLIEQFGNGVQFELAAQRFSASATAASGGAMGWVTETELEPEVVAAISALEGPGVTAPIITSQGIYLYAVRNKQLPAEGRVSVDLQQLVARDGAASALDIAIADGASCTTLSRIAGESENLSAIDIGTVDPETLNAETKARIFATPVGSFSEYFSVRNGLAVTFVCARREGEIELPSRQEVENQLYGQLLARISDRELRNLKRDAMIIRR